MSIFPYVYYMVSSFHITNDDKQIALYAGMVTSAFAFAEFSTGVMWGRLSDKLGRKPILLTGLGGTGISMLVFGFSPNLTTALIARALGGLLNGCVKPCGPIEFAILTLGAKEYRCPPNNSRRGCDCGSPPGSSLLYNALCVVSGVSFSNFVLPRMELTVHQLNRWFWTRWYPRRSCPKLSWIF